MINDTFMDSSMVIMFVIGCISLFVIFGGIFFGIPASIKAKKEKETMCYEMGGDLLEYNGQYSTTSYSCYNTETGERFFFGDEKE